MFAKIFETSAGQLLMYKDNDDEDNPCIRVVGEPVKGVIPSAVMSYDNESDRDNQFDNQTSDLAEETAVSFSSLVRDILNR